MKNPALLMFLLLAVITGCASSLKKQAEDITITYEAITRGSSMVITAKQGTVTTNTVMMEKKSTVSVTPAEWNEVIAELEKVDLDKIKELKAPTNKRFYDGALIASITVQLKDTVYHSSSFDHGNPPAEIEALVNKIISLSGADRKTAE